MTFGGLPILARDTGERCPLLGDHGRVKAMLVAGYLRYFLNRFPSAMAQIFGYTEISDILNAAGLGNSNQSLVQYLNSDPRHTSLERYLGLVPRLV